MRKRGLWVAFGEQGAKVSYDGANFVTIDGGTINGGGDYPDSIMLNLADAEDLHQALGEILVEAKKLKQFAEAGR